MVIKNEIKDKKEECVHESEPIVDHSDSRPNQWQIKRNKFEHMQYEKYLVGLC